MGTMQLVRGVGGSILIGGRSYTKTGIKPVVFIPAYKTLSGTVWHYWAVLGRSKGAAAGTVSTPEYTAEYNLTVNGRQVYVLTLDNGAFENGTLMISGPGTIPATIQTGAAGQWYDLGSMTGENAALQEAELLLRAAEQKQVALRMPGGGTSLKIQEYIRIRTVTTGSNDASIALDYYQDGVCTDTVTILYTNPNRTFHFITISYSSPYWTARANKPCFSASVSDSNATVSSSSYTSQTWNFESSRVYVACLVPNLDKMVGQALPI